MSKILIVDDMTSNRILLSHILTELFDYTIIEASDGQEAIEQFQKEQPWLILMDVTMPVMDGYTSAEKIKKLSHELHTPIIFVTALSEATSLSKALESGGDDFINKPYSPEVLESKINAHRRIYDLNLQVYNQNQQLKREQYLLGQFFDRIYQQNYKDSRLIKYHMSSMSEFNGDILFTSKSPQGGLYAIVGDFTGHGLTAAMGTLPVAQTFFKMTKQSALVSDIAQELNEQLNTLLPPGLFFAASIIYLNSSELTLTIWSGGISDSYLIDKEGKMKQILHSQHMALGILSAQEFDQIAMEIPVDQGDQLYVCSDGIIEAENPEGQMFSEERLENALLKYQENRFDHVISTLNDFTKSDAQTDDITLLELSCNLPSQ